MGLESVDFPKLREAVQIAVKAEALNVDKIRQKVQDFEVIPLESRQCHSVAPVAMDGGENQISFDPVHIEILRVVDSNDNDHLLEIIPLSAGIDYIEGRFDEVPILKNLLKRLGVNYGKLSYQLPEAGGGTPKQRERDLRSFLQVYRDIAEWAVLLDLAWGNTTGKTLLIRDGLLRTLYFQGSGDLKKSAFGRLKESFRQSYEEKGTFLVGVAKKSKVLNYLSLALTLEGTLKKSYPCFIEIPEEIEKEANISAKEWMFPRRSFGKLHLVKLNPDPGGYVYPVEIPEWLMSRRKEVLECLLGCSDRSFPIPGYPYPLVKAHENAVLQDLEMSVISDIVVDEFANRFDEKDGDRLWSYVTIGRGLYMRGMKQ